MTQIDGQEIAIASGYTYDRGWTDIQNMLLEAQERIDQWEKNCKDTNLTRRERIEAIRNYNALRGVVKTLRWVLGDPQVINPLD